MRLRTDSGETLSNDRQLVLSNNEYSSDNKTGANNKSEAGSEWLIPIS
jgi:hypothetical protein